jgi:hypothetical protein
MLCSLHAQRQQQQVGVRALPGAWLISQHQCIQCSLNWSWSQTGATEPAWQASLANKCNPGLQMLTRPPEENAAMQGVHKLFTLSGGSKQGALLTNQCPCP